MFKKISKGTVHQKQASALSTGGDDVAGVGCLQAVKYFRRHSECLELLRNPDDDRKSSLVSFADLKSRYALPSKIFQGLL
jgi:hypothetical protein